MSCSIGPRVGRGPAGPAERRPAPWAARQPSDGRNGSDVRSAAVSDYLVVGRPACPVMAGGEYDLTTPDGRLSARIVGAVARKESKDRSPHVRRKHLELAEQGSVGA